MYKFLLSLTLFGCASGAWAQGNYMYPNQQPMYASPMMPPALGYYPSVPYVAPMYPYPMQQPYYPNYPLQLPMQAYPNAWPQPLNSVVPSQTQAVAPSYQYTSPYNPNQPAMPGPKPAPAPQAKKETKPWGDTRYIWPDFYTDQTSDAWDKMINAPHDLGYMPGGWRFPSFSSPDPVTVGDAVANQVPPIMEEVPNFMNFTN